jgi:23S rRNA (pseudouridine1915-N3)-methyltransferase
MHLRILVVGKQGRGPWRELTLDYEKRIKRYTEFSLESVKEVKLSNQTAAQVKAREAKFLLQRLESNARVIALDKGGKQWSSERMAKFLSDLDLVAFKRVNFIIGGPLGLDERILQGAQTRLSLSAMTLPHDMATVILLEQLYRGFTILRGEQYHK